MVKHFHQFYFMFICQLKKSHTGSVYCDQDFCTAALLVNYQHTLKIIKVLTYLSVNFHFLLKLKHFHLLIQKLHYILDLGINLLMHLDTVHVSLNVKQTLTK